MRDSLATLAAMACAVLLICGCASTWTPAPPPPVGESFNGEPKRAAIAPWLTGKPDVGRDASMRLADCLAAHGAANFASFDLVDAAVVESGSDLQDPVMAGPAAAVISRAVGAEVVLYGSLDAKDWLSPWGGWRRSVSGVLGVYRETDGAMIGSFEYGDHVDFNDPNDVPSFREVATSAMNRLCAKILEKGWAHEDRERK